jgi:hypothetical protein
MAGKVLQLRKGLTREDLLAGSWMADPARLARFTEVEKAAWLAYQGVLDAFVAYVNTAERVSRKDVSAFFVSIENFTGLRLVINERVGSGDLTPSLLDKLVQDV